MDGDCPNIGGSCRFSKGWVGLGEPVKSVPNPSTERAVIDRATNLEQQIGAISRPSHLLGFVHPPVNFIPACCPHLDPVERLWGLMHKQIPHNRCHETFAAFKAAVLTFLREEVPRKWDIYCDKGTDDFRIISPKDFRVLA
jgi:hypothetical protein